MPGRVLGHGELELVDDVEVARLVDADGLHRLGDAHSGQDCDAVRPLAGSVVVDFREMLGLQMQPVLARRKLLLCSRDRNGERTQQMLLLELADDLRLRVLGDCTGPR